MCLITVVQLRGNFHEAAYGAQSITGLEMASLQEQYDQHCLRECPRVIKDPYLPPASLCLPLPSGRKIPDPQNMQQDNDSFFLWAALLFKTQNHTFIWTQHTGMFCSECLEALTPNISISHELVFLLIREPPACSQYVLSNQWSFLISASTSSFSKLLS